MGLWLVLWIGAGMTSFYMFRMVFLTFFGQPRDTHLAAHAHESPNVMTVPLILLAVGAATAGFVGVPESWGVGSNLIERFLEPVVAGHGHHEAAHVSHVTEFILMGLSVAIAVVGLLTASSLYIKNLDLPKRIAQRFSFGYKILYNKYYVDEIYDFLFVRPIRSISQRILWKIIDVGIIDDGLVNGTARFFTTLSMQLRKIQIGDLQGYAFGMTVGILGILGYLLLK